ncbi:MAG: hypoxanthine phosphoribosyltransferase [Dehalococcoidia bacterium]|nr:hypoxanthine phosphoribosyltransferase [Dehalococcoidia bacterium]
MNGTSLRCYKALKEVAEVANSALPPKKFLRSIAKSATKAINVDGCSVALKNTTGEHLVSISSYGLSDWYSRSSLLEQNHDLEQVMNGEVVFIPNARQDPRFQNSELVAREGMVSILSIPLTQRGEVIGALNVHSRTQREFSHAERDFLFAVGNLAVIASENIKLHDLMQQIPCDNTADDTALPKLTSSLASPPSFAHPSEKEFARLLDFYRIEWLYEPRSFPLQWEKDQAEEMFTPDFYLPAVNIYLEITTLKQKHQSDKNRKVRRLKKLYPEINIKLLNKKDYINILAKYGYGPLGQTTVQDIDRILFSENQIQERVRLLGEQISKDYANKQPLLIGILKGMFCFMADITRHITIPLSVDFMAISRYANDISGAVRITKDIEENITGKDILMIEDIVDTGMTLNYVLNYLSTHNPSSLHVCTLLDKKARRLINVPLTYKGFEIPDEFVVGYGLDYQDKYRNLPFIGVLRPELDKK